MTPKFDHEKLRVYRASLEFVRWSTRLLAETPVKAAVKDQLNRASTSVPLNLAPGKELLVSVASMLVGLTNSLEGRIAEEPAVYGSEHEHE